MTMKFTKNVIISIIFFFQLIYSTISTGESCDNNKGICIDTTKQTCDNGILKSGYCPGSYNILCCEPSDLPERCKVSDIPLINSSYLFTLQNQGNESNY
jgi:hypothetical protein